LFVIFALNNFYLIHILSKNYNFFRDIVAIFDTFIQISLKKIYIKATHVVFLCNDKVKKLLSTLNRKWR